MNIQSFGGFTTARYDQRSGTTESAQSARTSAASAEAPAAMQTPSADMAEPSRTELRAAIDKINQALPGSSRGLEFSIDDSSKQTVVKIVDQDTREVVRQIPSKEALEIAKALDKALGRLIKTTA